MILDTNALSAFADDVRGAVEQIGTAEELYVPVIVLGEYRFGYRYFPSPAGVRGLARARPCLLEHPAGG